MVLLNQMSFYVFRCLKSVNNINGDWNENKAWHDQVLQIKSKLDNTCVCTHVFHTWRADDLLLLYSNHRQLLSWSCLWPELHQCFFFSYLKMFWGCLFFYDISFSLATWLMLLLMHCLHLLQNPYISCWVNYNQRCRYTILP